MKDSYWLVIDALREMINSTADREMLTGARLSLSLELDRAVVGGTSSDEIERLIGVLDELSDKIAGE